MKAFEVQRGNGRDVYFFNGLAGVLTMFSTGFFARGPGVAPPFFIVFAMILVILTASRPNDFERNTGRK